MATLYMWLSHRRGKGLGGGGREGGVGWRDAGVRSFVANSEWDTYMLVAVGYIGV